VCLSVGTLSAQGSLNLNQRLRLEGCDLIVLLKPVPHLSEYVAELFVRGGPYGFHDGHGVDAIDVVCVAHFTLSRLVLCGFGCRASSALALPTDAPKGVSA